MSLLSKWEGRIVVPSGGWSDTGNFVLRESETGATEADISVDAGNYWWSSGDSGGNDFAAQLKEAIEAASVTLTNSNTYTVSVSAGEGGTGFVTITKSGGGTFDIDWGTADGQTVRDLCGYTGDISSAGTAASTTWAEGLWLPDCPVDTPWHLGSSGMPMSHSIVSLGEDGSYSQFTGSKFKRNEYIYQVVSDNRSVVAAESTTGESYEQFWLDTVRGEQPWAQAGRQLRFYKDTDDDATFKTYNVVNTQTPELSRADQDWTGMFSIRLDVVEN